MDIRVKVITDTRKESVTQGKDGRLVVYVRAPRKEGKANERLCALIAAYYAVSVANVVVVRGRTQSAKTVRIVDTTRKK